LIKQETVERIVDGLDKHNDKDYRFLIERYEFYKNQRNEQGLLNDFTTASRKARIDFVKKCLEEEVS
jgi:hypothetical protein